jgi:hypothetical protein
MGETGNDADPVRPMRSETSTTQQDSWLKSLGGLAREQAGTLIVGFFVSVFAIFSSNITDRIKFALNTADLRSKYFEEFAENLSAFDFEAELIVEYLGDGFTDSETWDSITKEYNPLITTLMNKEYVYLSWINRYWDPARVDDVEATYIAVKAFDSAIHSLNKDFYALKLKKIKNVNSDDVQQAMLRLRPALKTLQERSKKVLLELQ